ncbi:MAG: hypothetical protein GXO90_11170 [FCB group bacterium]|nr:hypothetical protein [FCB group bacterium]
METQQLRTAQPGLYPNKNLYHYQQPGSVLSGSDGLIIEDNVENKISFNVMPNRPVEERLIMRRYRVWDDAIEAEFDREYFSSMEKSPDHLIFVTVLVHLQKMIYVYMCHYCGIPYDPYNHELLKVWPTQLDISMPKLITKKTKIHHLLKVKSVIEMRPKQFMITADSSVENRIAVNGEAVVIRLDL